jgi:hypothetical protein
MTARSVKKWARTIYDNEWVRKILYFFGS